MTLLAALSKVLLAASTASAADHLPPPGSYGFNWLDANCHCAKLTDKDLAQAKDCTRSNNAFGLRLDSLVCKINARTELMVYKTQAQCQEALETMQANGP
jgi:hypothetical protein